MRDDWMEAAMDRHACRCVGIARSKRTCDSVLPEEEEEEEEEEEISMLNSAARAPAGSAVPDNRQSARIVLLLRDKATGREKDSPEVFRRVSSSSSSAARCAHSVHTLPLL